MKPSNTYGVVLLPFPFSDRASEKRRPAVVLSDPGFQQACGHLLLAMITSAAQSSWPLDWPIQDWQEAGLPKPCLVRFKLFTLDERLILKSLGALSAADRAGVSRHLSRLLNAGR